MEGAKDSGANLSREDIVRILGGSNVAKAANSADSGDNGNIKLAQQQESLACDAIG